jgi:3-deoxy-D-manno-octulosonic-acid transferase
LRTLYNAALLPVRAASFVFGAWPRGSPEADLERDQRLARRLPEVVPDSVWIHGASVGEARVIGALAGELRRLRPDQPLSASAVTATGRSMLPKPPDVDAAFFLPLDFPAVQRRAFDAVHPAMIVLVETELWPNLLTEAARRGVPAMIVNGRIAPERLKRYRRFSGLYAPLLRRLDAVAAAGADDGARFASLGVPERSIHVIGNLKFDLPAPDANAAQLRRRFGIDAGRPVVAAGSTGEGEDALVLDAFLEARREVPSLLLVLAPRHPDRFAAAASLAEQRGLSVSRVTGGTAAGADVLLVDTIGQLAALYTLAGSAFVGGSLVRVGGHNLLEPLAAGVPVLFGPHTDHVAEIAAALEGFGAGIRVEDAAALGRRWVELAARPDERARLLARGEAFLAAHRGALRRAADLMLSIRDRDRGGRPA